jgi:hypothetical protein
MKKVTALTAKSVKKINRRKMGKQIWKNKVKKERDGRSRS